MNIECVPKAIFTVPIHAHFPSGVDWIWGILRRPSSATRFSRLATHRPLGSCVCHSHFIYFARIFVDYNALLYVGQQFVLIPSCLPPFSTIHSVLWIYFLSHLAQLPFFPPPSPWFGSQFFYCLAGFLNNFFISFLRLKIVFMHVGRNWNFCFDKKQKIMHVAQRAERGRHF